MHLTYILALCCLQQRAADQLATSSMTPSTKQQGSSLCETHTSRSPHSLLPLIMSSLWILVTCDTPVKVRAGFGDRVLEVHGAVG